jgi:hypothetical protein
VRPQTEMKQASSFPYDQLHEMTFHQLFSLLVAITRWNWVLRREQSLVLLRAYERERMRVLHPAYAALLLREGQTS